MRYPFGASWQLVDSALARKFTLLLTVPLVLEYPAVLRREEHRKVHGLTMSQLDELIDSLVKVAEPVRIRFLWRPLLSDPRDDMALETAVNGGADLLVVEMNRLKARKTGVVGTFSRPPVSTAHPLRRF